VSQISFVPRHARLTSIIGLTFVIAACGESASTAPIAAPDQLLFTGAMVSSLDSATEVMVEANPGNSTLQSLADSTLLVLTAGVQAKRLDVSTNLTSAPLYFVGIHRTIERASGAFSTWTLVGIDDPSRLANILEVSGFAQVPSGPAPTSVSGSVGGTGSINGRLLQVATGGAVTEWTVASGSARFSSEAAGDACPGFTPTATMTCAMETMHVQFSISGGSTGAGNRTASQSTIVDVPAMRLTYTP
jgi:hypothetical protein